MGSLRPGGAAVGLAVQGYYDYQAGHLSSAGSYLGAFTSGALGGLALMSGGGVATTVTYGAGAGLVGNSVQQITDRASGKQASYSGSSAASSTIAGGVASGVLKPFAGLIESAYAPIAQGLLTKYLNGTISQASPQTIAKMVGTRILGDNTIAASLLEDPIRNSVTSVFGETGGSTTKSMGK